MSYRHTDNSKCGYPSTTAQRTSMPENACFGNTFSKPNHKIDHFVPDLDRHESRKHEPDIPAYARLCRPGVSPSIDLN